MRQQREEHRVLRAKKMQGTPTVMWCWHATTKQINNARFFLFQKEPQRNSPEVLINFPRNMRKLSRAPRNEGRTVPKHPLPQGSVKNEEWTSGPPPAAGCLVTIGGMFARRATFVLSIVSLAPSLSSPREVPQAARDRKPSMQSTLHKPKYENSTTQNVTPTTSIHHPCQHHKLGAKDGPDS